jgi:hypothetical protein
VVVDRGVDVVIADAFLALGCTVAALPDDTGAPAAAVGGSCRSSSRPRVSARRAGNAQGVLTGKYKPGQDAPAGSRATDAKGGADMIKRWIADDVLTRVQQLQPIASELDLSMAQPAVAWVLHNDNVASALVGASRPEQVIENVKAVRSDRQPSVGQTLASKGAPHNRGATSRIRPVRSVIPSRCRLQMACSIASSTSAVVMLLAVR